MMNNHGEEFLSESGKTRRDVMLDELTAAMKHHHRTKRARRSAFASTCLLAVLVGLAFLQWPRSQPPAVQIADRNQPEINPELGKPAVIISYVRTDPTILDRFTAHPTPRVNFIDDDELLAELVAMGRPTGLIRMGNTVRLTADVTTPLRKETDPSNQDPSSL